MNETKKWWRKKYISTFRERNKSYYISRYSVGILENKMLYAEIDAFIIFPQTMICHFAVIMIMIIFIFMKL